MYLSIIQHISKHGLELLFLSITRPKSRFRYRDKTSSPLHFARPMALGFYVQKFSHAWVFANISWYTWLLKLLFLLLEGSLVLFGCEQFSLVLFWSVMVSMTVLVKNAQQLEYYVVAELIMIPTKKRTFRIGVSTLLTNQIYQMYC